VNADELVLLTARLTHLWPNFAITEAAYGTWADILDGVPYAEAIEAVDGLAREGGAFPPTVGQVWRGVEDRREYTRFVEFLDRVEADRAEQAALMDEAWPRRAITATSTTHPQEEAP
jgi:hypothetical protein